MSIIQIYRLIGVLVFACLCAQTQADEIHFNNGCVYENVRILGSHADYLTIQTISGKNMYARRLYIEKTVMAAVDTSSDSRMTNCYYGQNHPFLFMPTVSFLDSLSSSAQVKHLPILVDGYLAFIDSTGQTLRFPEIKTQYQKSELIVKSVTRVHKLDFDSEVLFRDGLIVVHSGRSSYLTRDVHKYQCFTYEGVKTFEKACRWMGPFSEGLAQVEVPRRFLMFNFGSRFGYVGRDGEMRIKDKFEYAGRFSQGKAHVRKGKKYGYIDHSGEYAVRPIFEEAREFSDSLAAVKFEGKFGYINHRGQFVIQPTYDYAWGFKCGIARVKVGEFYGYIDKNGTYIFDPELTFALNFNDSLACVRYMDKMGYINPTGEFSIAPKYSNAGSFSCGLAPVEIENRWGYIDKNGRIRIAPIYQLAYPFVNSMGIVWQEKIPYYINPYGVVVRALYAGMDTE